MLTQEPVLDVDGGFSNEIISRDTIPVHDRDLEGVVERKEGWQFKHLAKDRVELVRDVVVFVVYNLLSNLHLQVWVRLKVQEGRGGGGGGGGGGVERVGRERGERESGRRVRRGVGR